MDPLRRLSAAERFARARALRHNPTPAERHAWTLLEGAGYRVIRVRNRDASREHLEAALREALGTNR